MNKPTWVFVAGAYRTASTTQYQITRDIVEMSNSGIGIGYHQEKKLVEFDGKIKDGLIVCKVFEFLPRGFRGSRSLGEGFLRAKRMKALCTIRDPRDIAASMRKRTVDLGNKLINGLEPKQGQWSFRKTVTIDFPIWLGQLNDWISLGENITLVTKYKEMITDLHTEVLRIAEHLGIHLDERLSREIAKNYTIAAINKKQVENRGKKADPWLPSVPAIVFGSTGIHRTWLTGPERRMVENANRELMTKWGYL